MLLSEPTAIRSGLPVMVTGLGRFSGEKGAEGAVRRPALTAETASRPRRHRTVKETTARTLRDRGDMVAHSFVDERQTETGYTRMLSDPATIMLASPLDMEEYSTERAA